MSAAPSKSLAKLPDRAVGSPRGYADLKAYLQTAKDRQVALGVTGNTIAAWDRRAASRIRRQHQQTVGIVLDTLRELDRIVGSPERAGRIFISPLPLLQDVVPARLVQAGGQAEADVLTSAIRKMQSVAEQTILKRVAEDDALWDSFEASLSPSARARGDRAAKAIEEFRTKTGSVSALD